MSHLLNFAKEQLTRVEEILAVPDLGIVRISLEHNGREITMYCHGNQARAAIEAERDNLTIYIKQHDTEKTDTPEGVS